MTRQEALQWCVENVTDWRKREVQHNILNIEDNWVFNFDGKYIKMVNISDNPEPPIAKQDWLEAQDKKAEPQAPYMPKVGEECESALVGAGFRVGQLLYKSEKLIVWQDTGTGDETANRPEHRIFRPLRTERELFIERATKDYLEQVGSDAVNAKWFGRIFGALYDAGNLSYKN